MATKKKIRKPIKKGPQPQGGGTEKVIIYPRPAPEPDTYYWVETDENNEPTFTTNLANAKRYDESIVEGVVTDLNNNNPGLNLYSGNPTTPPPPPF